MKWINVADNPPLRSWRGIVRRIGDKNTKGAFLFWNEDKNKYTGVFYEPDSISAGIDINLHNYEWLDESEDKLKETLPEYKSWADFYEQYMLSEDQSTGGIMGFMENTLPHGFKVGTKYKL